MNENLRRTFFRALLDHSLDNIYFKDLESRFLLVNRRMAQWFGVDNPDALIGRTDAELFAPPHAREALADEQALIRGDTDVIRKEEMETWPDGRTTWVSTVKRPLLDDDGRTIGTFGISRDITAQRQAQQAAEATHRQYRELVEIVNRSPAVVLEWGPGPDWPILYVSDNVRQLGCDADALRAGNVSHASLIHPEDITGVREEMDRILALSVDHYELTYRLAPPSTPVRYVEELGIIRRDPDGRVVGFQGVVLDVTRRHEAEAELHRYREELERRVEERTRDLQILNQRLQEENERRRASEVALTESEQRYRRLLETVTDYVYTVDLVHGEPAATRHSPGCQGVTGYTPEEYAADPFLWFEMIVEEDRPAVVAQSKQVIREGSAPPIEHRLRRKDGVIRWVRSHVSPRRDADGRIVGYDGLVKDITEQREAREARLRAECEALAARQQEMLERADRLSSLGLLAAGVAHEINNPLQGMLSHLDAVRRALPPDFSRMRNIEMVERGIETIAALVQRLRPVGGGEPQEGDCSLADAIAFVVELLGAQFERRGVRIVDESRALHVRLAIPLRELVQVLTNLLMNARDAMPEGGHIRIGSDVRGGEAIVEVADTGMGIPPDILPKIFTPFFTTKGAKGTGLGLTVAESIIRNHSGRIEVRSAPNAGTTFTLRVPLAGAGEKESAENEDSRSSG